MRAHEFLAACSLLLLCARWLAHTLQSVACGPQTVVRARPELSCPLGWPSKLADTDSGRHAHTDTRTNGKQASWAVK